MTRVLCQYCGTRPVSAPGALYCDVGRCVDEPPAKGLPDHRAVLGEEARKLADSLRYAAPETWEARILDALEGAYALGRVVSP